MQKIKLAVLMGDEVYRSRLCAYMMQHEKDRFELHIFTELPSLMDDPAKYDAIVCADCRKDAESAAAKRTEPIVYLLDEEKDNPEESSGRILMIEKYQEVGHIVDELRKNASMKPQITGNRRGDGGAKLIAVYSLAENEYQLPFLITLASVLGEENRVLILDLQENSGFAHLAGNVPESGLEDVFALAESGKYSRNRVLSAIGHMDNADFIYPAKNTECLCEASSATYATLLEMLGKTEDYSCILLNFGSRFNGFFEVLDRCQIIYLMTKSGGLCQWREMEFTEEATKRGYPGIPGKLVKVEVPIMTVPTSCERLVEQWKWNELGDMIRRMLLWPQRAERSGV